MLNFQHMSDLSDVLGFVLRFTIVSYLKFLNLWGQFASSEMHNWAMKRGGSL